MDRKSLGKSRIAVKKSIEVYNLVWDVPSIKLGMEPPVRKPIQSLVNELQLKSIIQYCMSICRYPPKQQYFVPNK